jgi:hypothetical protein
LKTIIIIILSLVALVVAFIGTIWTIGKIYDKLAVVKARRYCKENKLEFVEVKAFPNHYGLYFKNDGKSFYAGFDFERDRTITWKKGTPLDKVQRKKGSSAQHKL